MRYFPGKLARISDENYVQRTVRKAIKNDITIVAMHTNMDAAAPPSRTHWPSGII